MQDRQKKFLNPKDLSEWTKRLLYLLIIISIISIISDIKEYKLLSDIQNGIYTSKAIVMEKAQSNDKRQQEIAIVNLGISVLSLIFLFIWIHRVNHNGHLFDDSVMKISPGWSVGYFFIPILSLWKPYEILKEIWMVSINPNELKKIPKHTFISLWWFFTLLTITLFSIYRHLISGAEKINELINANLLSQLSSFTRILSAVFLIIVINKISQMQISYAKYKKLILY